MENINNVFLSGKIKQIYVTPKGEVKLKIMIARSHIIDGKRTVKRDKDDNVIRNIITVRFFDELAKKVSKNYKAGDYVNITAIVQTVRNHYSCTSAIEIWGMSIHSKSRSKINSAQDINSVEVQGKVAGIYETKYDTKILTIYTSIERSVLTPSLNPMNKTFASYTAITVPASFECDTGNYVNVKGAIRDPQNGKKRYIVAYKVTKVDPNERAM